MRNQSSNTAVGKHQTKQVRNRSRTAQKGVKCILRNVPENAFNPSLHLLYQQHCFGTFFRDHSGKCSVSHSGSFLSWTMGNIWGPWGQRERLCSLRFGRHNNSIKITAETVAAVFSKERAEEFELSVSAGHPRWHNWSSEGCQSFVWGLALVQDVDMALT